MKVMRSSLALRGLSHHAWIEEEVRTVFGGQQEERENRSLLMDGSCVA
jgi:hypothetical protein